MKFCISLGMFNSKCLLYYVLYAIFQIYNNIVLYYDKNIEIILYKNKLFHSFCYFLGYLINIFPALINQRNSETNENLLINEYEVENPQTIKFVILFFIICLSVLLTKFIANFSSIIRNKYKEDEENKEIYEEDFVFIEFIVIFLMSKFSKEVFYNHQNISFLILILIEIIKTIFLLTDKYSLQLEDIILIFLNIIYSILYAIYYIYMKKLMKYRYISPYKINFMIGLINLPIIIIIYIIISFTPLGKNKDDYYFCDSIFVL